MKIKKKGYQPTPAQQALLAQAIKRILASHPTKAFNQKQMAKSLKVEDEEFAMVMFENNLLEEDIKDAVLTMLQTLHGEKALEETDRGKYRIVMTPQQIQGIIEFTANGNAFIISDNGGQDIFVAANNTHTALPGDTVSVRLKIQRATKRPEGVVIEVLNRAKTEFVGTVHINGRTAFLEPSSNKYSVDFFILPGKLKGAVHGEKAILRMLEWNEKSTNPAGEIVKVLGMPGQHNVEMDAILVEFGFPLQFDDRVEAEAEKIPFDIDTKEIAKRRDMRGVTTFTIDPEDAKDFDDALSIQKLPNGHYEIGVHIADVSHYVVPGTALDNEAYKRATSVYLVDRVIPMLPEKLSNNVCSLRPNEDKLCFSAIFEMNDKAELVNEWFGRTVIHSNHRFTYEQAQSAIETRTGPYTEEVNILDVLAKKLRKQRFANGSINFDKVEVKFKLDEQANPIGVFLKVMKDSNQLIEEFMLLANKRVATFIGKYNAIYMLGNEQKIKTPPLLKTFVYRIHDVPDKDKIKQFAQFAAKFGYKLDVQTERNIAHSINKLVKDVQGKPEQNLLETLAIRSMAKAKYDTSNIGHYGLAFDYYSHFTSPIRRYPDVMAHRLLQHYLDGNGTEPMQYYSQACKHSSAMEVQATEAERASIKFKQVQYMQAHTGEVFDGIVSGVNDWGIFVELVDSKCEGMIRLRDMKDDYYELDEKNYCVRGSRNGRTFQLGDKLKVAVRNTDLQRKQIDFEMAEDEGHVVRKRIHEPVRGSKHAKANHKSHAQRKHRKK